MATEHAWKVRDTAAWMATPKTANMHPIAPTVFDDRQSISLQYQQAQMFDLRGHRAVEAAITVLFVP